MLISIADVLITLGLAVTAGLITHLIQRRYSENPRFSPALLAATGALLASAVWVATTKGTVSQQSAQPNGPTASTFTSTPPTTPPAPTPTATPTPTPTVEPEPTPDTEKTPAEDEPTDQAIPEPVPTVVDKIAVKTDRPDNAWGFQVGPNLIRMGGNGASIAVAWQARSGDVAVDGDYCQIKASIAGPEDQPAERSMDCSAGRDMTRVRSSPVSWTVMTAGKYTVTVVDELTGSKGSQTVTVLPPDG